MSTSCADPNLSGSGDGVPHPMIVTFGVVASLAPMILPGNQDLSQRRKAAEKSRVNIILFLCASAPFRETFLPYEYSRPPVRFFMMKSQSYSTPSPGPSGTGTCPFESIASVASR